MYVHEHSGHHQAAIALEKAFKAASAANECRLVDALRYTHPLLERLIRHTYLEIIRKKPEVWEYLYDNPWVLKNTQKLRASIHQSDSGKLKKLLSDFKPDAIVCTQAFPCGIVSDYKATHAYSVPLYGVLTDFLPHSYWVLDHVDRYFVPSQEAKKKLHENGIFEERISVTGIPIEELPKENLSKSEEALPMILIMGGSQGVGPIEKIVLALDDLSEDFEMVVAVGKNEALRRRMDRQRRNLKKKTTVVSYTENMASLMQRATLLVSKPGGLTIAQALASKLPVVFINPIPGQEAKNASFLLQHRAAVEAKSENELGLFVNQLLKTPAKMELMRKAMAPLAYPDAARRIALEILKN